ncbi:MAG: hypothetical protein HUK21_12415, partial [Fibrobacteraceae bacterium]|nr:hypothetical protein [Fibrobacteraceae bacterium]
MAGGAASSGAGYVATGLMTGADISFGDFFYQTMSGMGSGMIGGAVGTLGGAWGAIGGGFAGSASGAFFNGARGWDVLYAGLKGAGVSWSVYSLMWAYDNIGNGSVISGDAQVDPKNVKRPNSSDGNFIPDEFLREAEEMLIKERAVLAENGVDPLEFEAGASFRIKQHYWSGKNYLTIGGNGRIELSYAPIEGGVEFSSNTKDSFRMHLHPEDGILMASSNGIDLSSAYHPSAKDYANSSFFKGYGIDSYAAALRGNQRELYSYYLSGYNGHYRSFSW